ncbi:chalcone isomerase family protein [Photobacterium sp.]|uniref:chalcone isomerase family protein n=1 Tax=Photobacterium sp. TaxID=660 RepID=UPI00299DE97F|nr:chalcone isomerase family protein [Photobacterium sp.]MDX1301445.1 chalcone isomerase family protein [Photobacterium sp.]
MTGYQHIKQYRANMSLTAIVSMILLLAVTSANAGSYWQIWKTVGRAELSWGFWVIYDSELRTPDGTYNIDQQEMALVIRYRRDIDKEDLLEATDKQWAHLGIDRSMRQQWLGQLSLIWPDVKKGDRLIFVVNEQGAAFYLDQRLLGTVESEEMAKAFLGIWLDPKTAYPEIRSQLIG